jgi:C4-dicarboxylate-specific signal transduction histidine kinase
MIGGNGETIDVAITFNLVSPEGMEEPYVITIIQDITERKRLQEQVIEARKMASIGTLAAGLAHELNSPLQVITGTCETTLNRLQDGRMSLEQARAKVETINRSAWNCAAILRMLLEVAGPTADTFTAEDINDLIDEAIPLLLRLNSPARQYSTQTWPGRDLPRLVCKRGKILQLLNILLQNAADAMPDGGKVTIRSGYQPLSDEVWVQINDRGPGVPAELRKRIFEPFFTTRPQGQGRGLGLFILHNTLKAMDGYVTINDAESGGAAFTISLPVNASQVASRQTAQPGRYDLNNNTG